MCLMVLWMFGSSCIVLGLLVNLMRVLFMFRNSV